MRRLVLLGVLLSACQGGGLAAASQATTAEEERAAFALLVREGPVSFVAFDADGKQLDLAAAKWWERARTLRLGAGGRSIEHRLIDPKNVFELMHE